LRTLTIVLGLAVALLAVVQLPVQRAMADETADQPVAVAVFDFELIDTSLDGSVLGPQQAETDRLIRLGEQLRAAYERAPGYELLSIAPVAGKARAQNLQACGRCDRSLAQELGAELAVTGTVQKVSNLILNINIYVRSVETGKHVAAMSADIRGNTDESWTRGLDWLLRNRLKLEE
jgi:hypothetical protein